MERFTRQPASSSESTSQPASPAPASGGSNQGKFLDGTLGSKLLVLSLIVASIGVALALALNVWRSFNTSNLVKDDKYQAVFLDNGQVYFGHLGRVNAEYVRLTDIYYLQVEQQIQPDQNADEETPQQQISLAKLGNELHGPEDEMFVLRSKIVFWENLKDDGQVTQAIKNFVSGQQNN